MEQLKVNSFLVIEEALFDVGRVNIIIGPQANGKSLLAKLIYFFREVVNDTFIISVKNNENKKELLKSIEILFEYFPKYTWKDTFFTLTYKTTEYEINISKTKDQRVLTINLCSLLLQLHRSLKNDYRKFQKTIKTKDHYVDNFWEFQREFIFNNITFSANTNHSLFIPASRSFFANLQKNIFSLLSKSIDIDPFMKEFGSQYEFIKSVHSNSRLFGEKFKKNELYIKIQKIVEIILNGTYHFKDDQDWIKSKNGLLNLANASSGQQESLPMLLLLSIYPFLNKDNITFFIEEPEAHLFPVSQKHIVSLIALLYNKNNRVIITTHSPYILTAINNLLLAYDIKTKRGDDSIKNIVDIDTCINFDDVKAYTIKDGILTSIMDYDNRLIGINIIDSVSDEFNAVFDDLLSLEG